MAKRQLPVLADDNETIDALAMALVDEVVGGERSAKSIKAIAARLGIPYRQIGKLLDAARIRLASRAMFDQDIQRADAVTHNRAIIRRGRAMGAADLADFEPFLTDASTLSELRAGGLDTKLAKKATRKVTTQFDDEGECTGCTVENKIELYSPLEAANLELAARKELAKIFSLHRGAYDPPPAPPAGEVIDAVIGRPRDAAADVLYNAIEKHLTPLKLTDDINATFVDEIAAAGKEVRRLRRQLSVSSKQSAVTAKKRKKATAKKKKRKATP